MYPWSLLTSFGEFGSLLLVVFIGGVTFYPVASLLPRGYFFLFTTDAMDIGVYSLPSTIVQAVASVLAPITRPQARIRQVATIRGLVTTGYLLGRLCNFGLS